MVKTFIAVIHWRTTKGIRQKLTRKPIIVATFSEMPDKYRSWMRCEKTFSYTKDTGISMTNQHLIGRWTTCLSNRSKQLLYHRTNNCTKSHVVHDDALPTKLDFTERLLVELPCDLVKLEDPFGLPVLWIRGDEDHMIVLAPLLKGIHFPMVNLVGPVTKPSIDIKDTVVPELKGLFQ